MSQNPYPNACDLAELTAAHDLLMTHGISERVTGYDLTILAAATYVAGWSYRIDRALGMPGYEIEVQLPDGITRHRALGWEPAVALAFAVSTALAATSVR